MVFTGRTHAIKRGQFGILGPDEIRNMSVTQKTNARERAVDAVANVAVVVLAEATPA